MKTIKLIAPIIILILSSCNKDEIASELSNEKTKGVFICGSKYDNDKATPSLWINNNVYSLEDLGYGGRAFDMVFVGNDIYTVGYINQLSNTNHHKLVVWKNFEVETELTNWLPNGYSYKYSIAVNENNNDIYVAGREQLEGQLPKAKIWKNGVSSSLTDNNGTNSFDIEINNNDIYVVGCEPDANNIEKAVVWKNGIPTYLTDGTHNAVAQSITIIGNDIYISGREENTTGKYIAKYWKNGVVTNLTDGTNDAAANSIKVDEGNVFVGGFEINSNGKHVAKYWKNGEPNILTDGMDNGSVYSLSVFNNTVYTVGFNYTNIATLWANKNNKLSLQNNNFSAVIIR
jgi:hypothetical protein